MGVGLYKMLGDRLQDIFWNRAHLAHFIQDKDMRDLRDAYAN